MLRSNVEMEEAQVWTTTLQAARAQLARREQELRNLQAEYLKLQKQLESERERSERLMALADRFGAR